MHLLNYLLTLLFDIKLFKHSIISFSLNGISVVIFSGNTPSGLFFKKVNILSC